jgi:hypothetical protein
MPDFVMKKTPLTVEELISYLQELVKKDPKMKDALICHEEFGAITKSHTLFTTELDSEDGDKPAVVISGN